jgi:signal transduction histidine kinase
LRPRLLLIHLVLVLVPLGLLIWLGLRLDRDERTAVAAQLERLAAGRLADKRRTIERVVTDLERRLVRRTEDRAGDAADLRRLARRSPWVRQVFALGADCGRLHPPSAGPLSRGERAFVARASAVWSDWVALCRLGVAARADRPDRPERPEPGGERGSAAQQGWYTWRWGGAGADLVFWHRPPDGGLIGVEIDSIRLLADLVAALPATGAAQADERIALLDAGGRVLYAWGSHQPEAGAEPLAAQALGAPLSHWRLVYHGGSAATAALAAGSRFNRLLLLGLTGLLVIGLVGYSLRQQTRLLREATQRVSFVNRVSHELRSPLTNIRLYAELLAGRLAQADDKTRRQLAVIAGESTRLGRLIGNVLDFARQQRGELRVRPAAAEVDAEIRRVLESFAPALADKGLVLETELDAPGEVALDRDALEQILANLLSNVEKYVPDGGRVRIVSRRRGEQTRIEVADDGPGIPRRWAQRVFEPFFRLSDRLSDGVTGTGLGLGIARELARKHGGELRLLPSDRGAHFALSLHTPPAAAGAGGAP